MKQIRTALVTLLTAAAMSTALSAAARAERQGNRWEHPILRLGQDYTLKSGDAVREVVVVFGDAMIEGHVDQNVVVVFGKAQLSNTAFIDGSLIVIGGAAIASTGAVVGEDLVVVGGGFDAPVGFTPGRQHIVVGPAAIGGRLEAIVPWITRGLLWGRPIVPDLAWVWWVAGIFFLVYLALNLVFDHPVRACAATLASKPLTAFLVGLLVLLLMGPVCLLLAVSVIGLAVVPFVLCALFVAALIGKVGVARWIGMIVLRQESEESRLQSVLGFTIGIGVITVAYMVPVLGVVAWTMLWVFGLGAATLAFIAAYRRENPTPARGIPPSVPPPPLQDHERTPALPTHDPPAVTSSPPAPAVSTTTVAHLTVAHLTVADLTAFPRAAFTDRLFAFALDVILVVIAQQLLDLTRRDSAIFLLLLAYHIGFWTWKGTTVGGIICQLRVVRVDAAPLRFADALVRGLSSIFSIAVLGIGCLWILKDPERQAWHDKIAGTYVVKVPRNWPL